MNETFHEFGLAAIILVSVKGVFEIFYGQTGKRGNCGTGAISILPMAHATLLDKFFQIVSGRQGGGQACNKNKN